MTTNDSPTTTLAIGDHVRHIPTGETWVVTVGAKAKAATYMMPGEHTFGASPAKPAFPGAGVTTIVNDDNWHVIPVTKHKAKKVRKQWCIVLSFPSKEKAEELVAFHKIVRPGSHCVTVRYLPVGRGRKGQPNG